jgi:hypothetical protein
MSAVEIPKEIADELAAASARDQDQSAGIPQEIPAAADLSESIADDAYEATSGGSEAIVLPEEPAKVAAVAEESKKKWPKPLRRNSASIVLWVLLLLAAAAGAG